ncbi:hypothetical protein ABSDF2277 [Acinetobacter baumannii SDF]|uniref:Uncharacterized protein n=1 Tax=Acinetobacter baumannii (strain SDF) TaxID=509170 RepID=B0VRS8_ACIBS|nr:hypothetical protein ABSDF2277 [Acinetobacter baumannii SDF]
MGRCCRSRYCKLYCLGQLRGHFAAFGARELLRTASANPDPDTSALHRWHHIHAIVRADAVPILRVAVFSPKGLHLGTNRYADGTARARCPSA